MGTMNFSYDVCSRIPEPLEPYGDIAGLGVVLAFVISAWLTILILVAYYIFAFDPHTDPFSNTSSMATYSPNPLDVLLAKYTNYVRFRKSFRGELIEDAFHKLVTGISILVSGYMSLKQGQGLSAYYWKMVISLAWFSSVTHLSALSFLRSYLAKHPRRRLWRLAMMLILLILLSVGFIPTGHFNFLTGHLDADGHLDGAEDQIRYTKFIDLGQATYPPDCEDYNTSNYYTDYPFRIDDDLTKLDAELLRNGTIGPASCTILGKKIFQPSIASDTINFFQEKYLRLRRNIQSYYGGQIQDRVEIAILYESAAVCYFKTGMKTSTDAFVSMISSLLLLLYGYLIRASKTFEGSSRVVSQQVQSVLDRGYVAWMRILERLLSRGSAPIATVTVMCLLPVQASVYCTIRVFVHLYTSMFAEVFSVLLSAIWGTLSIKNIKDLSSSNLYEETEWTFGQIIAIALLSSSLLPIFELLYVVVLEAEDQRHIITHDTSHTGSFHDPGDVVSAAIHAQQLHNTPVIAQGSSTRNPDIERCNSESLPLSEQISSQNSVRLRPLYLHDQTLSLNDFATNQAGSSVSSVEVFSHDIRNLINDSGQENEMKMRIERRLQESIYAYEQTWTAATIFIMSGPFVFVILRLLPATRSMLVSISADYQPTGHLVSSAKMLAFLPCFIQQYIYLRLRINRLKGQKRRSLLIGLLAMIIAGASIVLCIFIDLAYYIVIACIAAGLACMGALVSGEFFWLMIQHFKEKRCQRRYLRSAEEEAPAPAAEELLVFLNTAVYHLAPANKKHGYHGVQKCNELSHYISNVRSLRWR